METTVTLPGGWWRNGVRHQQVFLRPVTGEEEALLAASREHLAPLQRATAVLARCVQGLDGLDQVRVDDLRGLCMGDREALLLHLRRATLGDRVECVVTCPRAPCHEPMDISLRVSDLLQRTYVDWRPRFDARVEAGGTLYHVQFRPPTAADVERQIDVAARDPRSAGTRLVADCILNAEPRLPADGPVPRAVVDLVSEAMLQVDPQAETRLSTTCSGCGGPVTTVLDAASFFLDELTSRSAEFHADVHALALNYHWSLEEILRLTPRQRQAYAGFLRPRDAV